MAAGVAGKSYRVRARGQEMTLQERAKWRGGRGGGRYVRKGPGSVRREDGGEKEREERMRAER